MENRKLKSQQNNHNDSLNMSKTDYESKMQTVIRNYLEELTQLRDENQKLRGIIED